MALRVVIFEDNDVLRQSLATLLNSDDDYEVVGQYNNPLDARHIILSKLPDVVILDIDMPSLDGISAISVIKEANTDVSIVMYTQFEDDDKLFRSLCAGADGYILKKTSPLRLFDAIKEVQKGGAPLSPSIAKKVLSAFREKSKPVGHHYDLTARENEILHLLVKGYSVKLIAAELNIAYDTSRTHLRNIYRKLHVNCGKEAIAKVLSEKIIS